MLTATRAGGELVVEAMLPAGTLAYFDAEWLPTDGAAALEPLLVEDGRRLRRHEAEVEIPDGIAPDVAAGLALAAVAAEAVALATATVPPAEVEVTGDGALAAHARELVGGGRARTPGPQAVVDTTGDEVTIIAATQRITDLGVLVLAGEPGGRQVGMNLYPDVHCRGLSIIGAGLPLSNGVAESISGSAGQMPRALADTLVRLRHGARIARPRGWYRLSADG